MEETRLNFFKPTVAPQNSDQLLGITGLQETYRIAEDTVPKEFVLAPSGNSSNSEEVTNFRRLIGASSYSNLGSGFKEDEQKSYLV